MDDLELRRGFWCRPGFLQRDWDGTKPNSIRKHVFFLLRKVRTALHFCRGASSGFYEFRCTAVVAEVEVVGFASTLADDVCCYWNGEIKQTWSKWRSQCPPMTLGYCVKVEPDLGCVTLSHFWVWDLFSIPRRLLRLYLFLTVKDFSRKPAIQKVSNHEEDTIYLTKLTSLFLDIILENYQNIPTYKMIYSHDSSQNQFNHAFI